MRRIFLLANFTLCALFANAQSYNWQWTTGALNHDSSTRAFVYPYCSTIDAAGNVIVGGDYRADSITFGSYTLYSPKDSLEAYVVKYDTSGHVLWAASGTGSLNQYLYGVTTDKNNNVYISGIFESPYIVFGGDTIHQPHPSSHTVEGYLVKYSPGGNVIWAKGFGSSSSQFGTIATDTSGNLYISGFFYGDSIVFGGITLHDSTGLNGNNGVLLKCDTAGNVIWARTCAYTWAGAMALDAAGNIILSGGFWGKDTISFNGIKVSSIGNVLTGNQEYYIAKYDVNGNPIWAKNTGLTGDSYAWNVSSDLSGNALLTGYYVADSVVIGGQTFYGSDSSQNFFITKYDASGNVLWVRGATGQAESNEAVADANGNTWVTGTFYDGSVQFGTNVLYNPDSATSDGHMFLLEYDANGNIINDMALGGNLYDEADFLSIDAAGNLYLAGIINSDSVAFGSVVLDCSPDNNTTPFVAKYAFSPTAGITEPVISNLVNVFPNPSSTGEWMLQVGNNILGGTCAIYDMEGRLIYKSQINNLNTPINVAGASGVYLLTVTSGSTCTTKKLVKL